MWELVESNIRAGGEYPPSFYALLVIAGLIGAVGILTNSQILIVAAMVVGPEYGAIMATALGINKGDRRAVRRGLAALTAGFATGGCRHAGLRAAHPVVRPDPAALPGRAYGRSPTSSTRRTCSRSSWRCWPALSASSR